jgi:hypothetical protein
MTGESGIVEEEEPAVARQRRGIHISGAANKHATIEKLLEEVIPIRPVTRVIVLARPAAIRPTRSSQSRVLSFIVSSCYLATDTERTVLHTCCSCSDL